uniref:Uncharacterized protein n=1 Tax=Leersia perrieri TaxID=77586 RepID=A0A0D9V8W4_9ORYZ
MEPTHHAPRQVHALPLTATSTAEQCRFTLPACPESVAALATIGEQPSSSYEEKAQLVGLIGNAPHCHMSHF